MALIVSNSSVTSIAAGLLVLLSLATLLLGWPLCVGELPEDFVVEEIPWKDYTEGEPVKTVDPFIWAASNNSNLCCDQTQVMEDSFQTTLVLLEEEVEQAQEPTLINSQESASKVHLSMNL